MLTRDLFRVLECGVTLQGPDGRPTIAVDNLRMTSDEPRLTWLAGAWHRDRYIGPASHMLALPLIYPRGLLGHIRCGQQHPYTAEQRHELQTLSTAASV